MRLAWLALILFACSGPASEGDACSSSNSTDDCDDGLVCTKEPTQTVCRLLCDDAAVTCPAGTFCSGVAGGSHKSCQPPVR
jgi:hypothetical protein